MSWLSRIAGGVLAGMLLSISVSFAEDKAASDYAVSVNPMVKVHMHDNLRKKLGGNDDLRSLCSGLKICMNQVFEGCFEDDMKPWPKVKYDDEFCKPYKELANRGYKADPKAPMVPEIYARLGRQYRVEYTYAGTLPLDENVIKYLFDNMPFTAQLINAYLDENYVLEYTHPNRRFFNGSNGRSLSGEFYWALQDSAGQKLGMRDLFFGYGHAKILKWALHGTAIAYLDMDPMPGKIIKYKLTAIVFPGNSVLNSIMQMKVFRSVVNTKIEQIVNDIKKASGMYFSGNKEPMLKSAALKSEENVQYVLDFEEVVNGAHWELGDFERLQKARKQKREQDMQAVPIMVKDLQIIKEKK
ncbi:hypothetical protein [Fibrobacter succinogenes]|uniref:hypothetical protein n=1 Tax=Fibrobacter succinogenes TaxID=833 RepID=UPI0013D08C11|nr:hypothetical protein [Fibrobacter succinogenes]